MEIKEHKRGTTKIIGLCGRLDTTAAPDFENKLINLLQLGEKRIVLDLSKLTYISSVGLRAMVLVAKNIQLTKAELALAAPGNHILEIFKVAGFTKIFSIYPTCDEAMARFQPDAMSPDDSVADPRV